MEDKEQKSLYTGKAKTYNERMQEVEEPEKPKEEEKEGEKEEKAP